MNIIVFTNDIMGHHLEYVHHIYEMAIEDKKNTYVFLLPKAFADIAYKFVWKDSTNISFDFFEDLKSVENLNHTLQILRDSYKICRFVARKVNKYRADIVYSNHMITFVPFAPLFIRKRTKLVGIIYRIYLYDLGKLSLVSKIADKAKYLVMSYFKVYYRVLILNDEESARQLNNIYKTAKFIPIPDPYNPVSSSKTYEIRKLFEIDNNQILFVHFGAMNANKGTLEIMESIKELDEIERQKYSFIFAGRIYDDIKNEFYLRYNELKDDAQIIVKDEYCSYDFFASLCEACNAILIPYKRTSQSSGLIGYASRYGKPVLVPSKGLLGHLVLKYKLGILLDSCDSKSLKKAYKRISIGDFVPPNNEYCKINNVKNFQTVIKNNLT